MKNKMQIFNNNAFGELRTVEKDGQIWFVGKDVAEILGYQNGSRDINRHVDEDDRQNYQNGTFESNRGLTIINESGLYSLVLSSRLPTAKAFKHWITSEVLPDIRNHGGYLTPSKIEEVLTDPDTLIKLATKLKEERAARQKAEASLEEAKPKVIFADAVSASKQTILVGELAKLLKQNGIEIGANRLFQWLRHNGFLMNRKGSDYNKPTQKSMEMGLFEIKESTVVHSDGHTSICSTPKITGKGQQYFINKFLNHKVEKAGVVA